MRGVPQRGGGSIQIIDFLLLLHYQLQCKHHKNSYQYLYYRIESLSFRNFPGFLFFWHPFSDFPGHNDLHRPVQPPDLHENSKSLQYSYQYIFVSETVQGSLSESNTIAFFPKGSYLYATVSLLFHLLYCVAYTPPVASRHPPRKRGGQGFYFTFPLLISIVLPSLVNRPGSQQVMNT